MPFALDAATRLVHGLLGLLQQGLFFPGALRTGDWPGLRQDTA